MIARLDYLAVQLQRLKLDNAILLDRTKWHYGKWGRQKLEHLTLKVPRSPIISAGLYNFQHLRV